MEFGTLIRHILAYLHPKFRDISAEVEGVMNDYIAKNGLITLVILTA